MREMVESPFRNLMLCILLYLVFCTHCGVLLTEVHRFCTQCGTKNRSHGNSDYERGTGIPEFDNTDDAIKYYFKQNFTNQAIRCFMEKYPSMNISLRTLKRKLKDLGLKKCNNNVADAVVRQIIVRELNGPNSSRGYRSMWGHLRCSYCLHVPRDQVN